MADNQSALKLLKNPVSSMRSEHIDVAHHFARERVTRRDVEFNYMYVMHPHRRHACMLADMFTKAVSGSKLLSTCCGGIGVE